MCVASKNGADGKSNLSNRMLNTVLEVTPTSTVTGGVDEFIEST